MAAADILDVVTSSEGATTTTHTVDLPADVAVGEWVVVVFAVDDALGNVTTGPDGWAASTLGTESVPLGAIFVHECHGLEDWFGAVSPSIEVTTSSAVVSSHIALRASTGGVTVTVGVTQATQDAPDPPAAQALWLDNETSVDVVSVVGIVAIHSADHSVDNYPAGYGDDETFVIDDDGTTFVSAAIAADDVTATGDVNPGAFDLSAAVDATQPFTILLFPAPDFLAWELPDTGLIDVSVQIAVTDGLMVGYPVRWLGITDQVREFSWQRGRQQQLDVVEAGTATLLLDNNDGDWRSSNTTGAYYPYVDLMLPIRIVARSNSVMYFLFTGYLERLPLVAPGRDDHLVQATAVDALKVFGLQATSQSRDVIVESLDPVAWWRMTDTATGDSADPGGHTLTWGGDPTTGVAGIWPNDEAVNLDGSGDIATVASEADVELRADMTVECWFQPTSTLGSLFACIGTTILYEIVWSSADAIIVGPTSADLNFQQFATGAALAGEWSHLVVTIDWTGTTRTIGVWVNGVGYPESTFSYQPGVEARTVSIGGHTSSVWDDFAGNISELAVYDKVLTATEISSLYAAQRQTWPAAQLTSVRIAQSLDVVGWVPRSIRTGQTSMQAAEPATDPREDINRAATTEAGLFFINGQGVAVFHDRHYRILQQGTANATFTTTDGAGIHYADVVIGTDDTQLWTEVQVTPGTVDNTSTDAAATAVARSDNHRKYGLRSLPLETFPNDRDDGLRMARHLLTRYDTPFERIDQISFQVGYTQAEVTALLGAELGDRYAVVRALPGDDFSEQVHLEAVSHTVSQAGWQCDWWLSPADTQTYWVLGRAGSSELGVTTRLAF